MSQFINHQYLHPNKKWCLYPPLPPFADCHHSSVNVDNICTLQNNAIFKVPCLKWVRLCWVTFNCRYPIFKCEVARYTMFYFGDGPKCLQFFSQSALGFMSIRTRLPTYWKDYQGFSPVHITERQPQYISTTITPVIMCRMSTLRSQC